MAFVDPVAPGDGRVLVTGGAGFIGSALVGRLVRAGHEVRVMELPWVETSHLPERAAVCRGCITSASDAHAAVAGCDAVIHLAGNPNLYHVDPTAFERVNHQGTRRILEACAATRRVRRMVYLGTESVLASPDPDAVADEQTWLAGALMSGPYLRSKWLAEQAAWSAARAGQPVILAVPAVPIGPGERGAGGPLTRLIRQFLRGRIRAYLPGTINVIDVRDLAKAIERALCVGRPGRRYLLSGHNLTYTAFFDALAAASGIPAPKWQIPYPLALGYAHLEEWVCRHLLNATPLASVTGVRLTRRSFRFDNTRSRAELRWSLRDLDASLTDAVAWLVASMRREPGARLCPGPVREG